LAAKTGNSWSARREWEEEKERKKRNFSISENKFQPNADSQKAIFEN
jgi:hypothetical protein